MRRLSYEASHAAVGVARASDHGFWAGVEDPGDIDVVAMYEAYAPGGCALDPGSWLRNAQAGAQVALLVYG